jgi:hypothetical protein
MITKEDLVAAIAKLNDLTRRKVVVWTPTAQEGGSARSFSTTYDGRRLRISELILSPADRRYGRVKTGRCILEILDETGNPAYQFPDVQGIADLFASVRAQQSDVDVEGLIKSLLAQQ